MAAHTSYDVFGSYCRYSLLVYIAMKRYLTEHFGSGGNACDIREAPDANLGRAIDCYDWVFVVFLGPSRRV
jgi:hypothetical protein